LQAQLASQLLSFAIRFTHRQENPMKPLIKSCLACTLSLFFGVAGCSNNSSVVASSDAGPRTDATSADDSGGGDLLGDAGGDELVVAVEGGKLRGMVHGPAIAYLGVPYAAPPVGELRWRSPKPVNAWSGIRDANKYGAVCPQIAADNNNWHYPENPDRVAIDQPYGNEDCLFLNVWTPKLDGGPYPVMVFLHGGGNNRGSSVQPLGDVVSLDRAGPALYEGQRLAARGQVIVVTINYRLGVLGFMIHPDLAKEDENGVSGNYGIRDQIAALTWVKNNIAQFGGDPSRVTVFGQSGGGRDVAVLLASPVAAGLFHRAIAHSAPWNVHQQAFFRADQDAFIKEMGCDKSASPLSCLRALSPEKMVTAKHAQPLGAASFPFHPSVDGYILPKAPPQAFADGSFNKVPFMTGTTEAEHSHWEQYQNLDQKAFNAALAQLVGGVGQAFDEAKALYSVAKYGDYPSAYIAAYDDRGVTCSTVRNVANIAKHNTSATYTYRFRQLLSTDKRLGFGPYHTSDLVFLFQHLDGTQFSATDDERKVADAMAEYWTRFAATGDPSGGKQPAWPAHDAQGGRYQSLEPLPVAMQFLKKDECAFWNSLRP
jgi:para-nitrobenzyl esterase